MAKQNETGLISYINKQRRTNHKDFQNCLFACFLSQIEPKKVTQALDDESWVEAMQEELFQFKLLNIWTLVDLPEGKKAIGTKWVYRNKKDQRRVVIRNKARLMDVKCAFLYGTIEEEVYVSQPPGFVDPDFPNKVYKVEKALYGLHQAPRAWYETLSNYLLENRFKRGTIDKTLFIKKIKNDILLYEDNKHTYGDTQSLATNTAKPDVDVHLYRSMIGSLMYLTSSRPDIMFVVCACSRYQVQPKASHMHAVKRIFRYLKGQPTLGLWYPKDSPLDLIAYYDSNYGGANIDRKSTTGGCQLLGCRLVSWQCKKQTSIATSTTKAECIAASNCCGQVLWLQNQLLDYGYNFMKTKIHIDNESTISVIKNPVAHLKTKHIEIRFHFIIDSYEKNLIEMIKIHTHNNVADLLTKAFDVTRYALTTNPTIYVSLVEQFWQTSTVKTFTNGEQKLIATVDGHKFTITEASVRRHLQLADVDGLSSLPNTEIFENLSRMGQGEGPTLFVESQHTPVTSPTTSQPTATHPISSPEPSLQGPTSEPASPTSPPSTVPQIPQTTITLPHDSPLPGGYTPGSDEGS
ncbi:putative ribonuclease H-like domain-containing protein [Tanacetum coccineum]